MTNIADWNKKDEWHKRAIDFLVVVKHHTVAQSQFSIGEGVHRWNVYAYIYPKHRIFEDFIGPAIMQPATDFLPLHGGCSFLSWHRDVNGNPTSVQVGSDYNHLHDTEFTHYDNPEDANEVFSDAERLFQHLAAIK